MRIAMISPLEIRVPPLGYGGTELVVGLLTDGLVRRGHDVWGECRSPRFIRRDMAQGTCRASVHPRTRGLSSAGRRAA